MFRRVLFSAAFALVLGTIGLQANSAEACPMCKTANETDSKLPRAYMTSILFMLAMPATILTGFGVTFWRLSKKQQMLQAAARHDEQAE